MAVKTQVKDAQTQAFESAGFQLVSGDAPKRLLIGSQGRERTGKTHFALGMPGPIAYVGLDFGHEGVIEKSAKGKKIFMYTMNVPPVANQPEYVQHWLKLKQAIEWAITKSKARSVVLDTGSDIWELLRLAQFGKLNPRGDIKSIYQEVNQAYRSIIRMAYDEDICMDVLHKVKPLYTTKTLNTQNGPVTQEVWDGQSYKRAGFGEGGYLVQCQIEHLFDAERGKNLEDKFGIRVIDCRQNMSLVGMVLWGKEATFSSLASYVFDCDEKDFQ